MVDQRLITLKAVAASVATLALFGLSSYVGLLYLKPAIEPKEDNLRSIDSSFVYFDALSNEARKIKTIPITSEAIARSAEQINKPKEDLLRHKTKPSETQPLGWTAASVASPRNSASEPLRQFFPWPPPMPSATKKISLNKLRINRIQTLGELAGILEQRLEERGYTDVRYYSVNDSGFALVTRLEQIDVYGKPLEGADRWPSYRALKSLEFSKTQFDIWGYLNALLRPGDDTGPEAHYRLFVFLVAAGSVAPDKQQDINAEVVRSWVSLGRLSLDKNYSEKPLTKEHATTILVYELISTPKKKPFVMIPSRLPGQQHILASGLRF